MSTGERKFRYSGCVSRKKKSWKNKIKSTFLKLILYNEMLMVSIVV